MEDIFKNVTGYFTLMAFDAEDNLVDKYEEKNMIMSSAQSIMGRRLAGLNARYLNKFVLGTKGHKNAGLSNADILTPKGEEEGFIPTRTELFSEEDNAFTYPISFRITEATGTGIIDSEINSGSSVSVSETEDGIRYRFSIPTGAANGSGINIFTEAALYSNDEIFSMKCFKGKIKDSAVRFLIYWDIKF